MKTIVLAGLGLLLTPIMVDAQAAQTIYSGGPILTMSDDAPRAEAVAVANGRILAVGALADIEAHAVAATERVDLDGRALLPGFVDGHGHVTFVGFQALAANLLPPPDGQGSDIPTLQKLLIDYAAENADLVATGGAIYGFGYDDSQLAEQRHPTRQELDAVSTDLPVYIIHQSGHLAVANTKALEIAGFDADTRDPTGGVIRREADGFPNGVLEETPHFMALLALTKGLSDKNWQDIFRAGVGLLARYGYTTAQDGRTSPDQVRASQIVAQEDGGLIIDVVSYPDVLVDRGFVAQTVSPDYVNGFRVGGAKLTIDGSPQGFTAWRDRPYYNPPDNFPEDYRGYPAVLPEMAKAALAWAYENDIQILTHANGEAASDLLIEGLTEAEAAHGAGDRRPVLIHGQFLRPDQVDAYQDLGVFASLFPMHTFYWGDWHRDRTVGPERADNISPTGWLIDRGMMFSTHHDAPVALPDSMRVLDATVTRRTRSGDILGPMQRVDVMTALKAMTIWPAYQHFEEDQKGAIEPGKLADFVMLSADPTAVDPETLESLTVEMTIKEGVVVYAPE